MMEDHTTLQADWERLSPEEKDSQSERFEYFCSQGIGDMHRFYPLLMPRALKGYVGD